MAKGVIAPDHGAARIGVLEKTASQTVS